MTSVLNLTDRQTIRDLFYNGLNTYLTSTHKYLKAFYNHSPSPDELKGQSPAGWIQSAGTGDDAPSVGSRVETDFSFIIQIVVKLAGDSSDDAVEDRLDLINKAIRDYIYHPDQRQVADTYMVSKLDPSTCGFSTIGGVEYRTEIYGFSVEVKNG